MLTALCSLFTAAGSALVVCVQVVGVVGFNNQRLPLPDDLQPAVVDLVQRCWASRPEERPSFSEVLAALSVLEEEGLMASESTLAQRDSGSHE